MLKKLFKYDFKAIGRIMLPLCLATLIVGIFSAFTSRPLGRHMAGAKFTGYSTTIMVVYICLFLGTCIMSIVMSVLRFKNNILGNEGYLTNVLPVSADKLIISKTLSASLWQVITGIFAAVSCSLTITIVFSDFSIFDFGKFLYDITYIFRNLYLFEAKEIINTVIIIVLLLILAVESIFQTNLMFYASLAVGHTANNKKVAASFGVFVGFYIASQIINIFLINMWVKLSNSIDFVINRANDMAEFLFVLIPLILVVTAYNACYYFITRYFITKKLNLE